jgi:hypothetical protein
VTHAPSPTKPNSTHARLDSQVQLMQVEEAAHPCITIKRSRKAEQNGLGKSILKRARMAAAAGAGRAGVA